MPRPQSDARSAPHTRAPRPGAIGCSLRACTLAATIWGLGAGVAEAQSWQEPHRIGLYGSITAMASAIDPSEAKNTSTGALAGNTAVDGDTSTGLSLAANIAVGYSLHRYNLPFRFDFEYTIRGKQFYSADPYLKERNSGFLLDGVIEQQSLLFNTHIDTKLDVYGFYPFLTISAGWAWTTGEAERIADGNGDLVRVDNRNTNIGWGGGIGATRPIAPGWNLDLRYRYLDLGEVEFGPTPVVNGASGQITVEHVRNHELGFGFRYTF